MRGHRSRRKKCRGCKEVFAVALGLRKNWRRGGRMEEEEQGEGRKKRGRREEEEREREEGKGGRSRKIEENF